MRYRHVAALLILGALLNLAGPVHAQRPQPKSPEERYEDMNKSPFLAATLEWIIPTVGHDYAGDREAGMPAVYLLLGGLGVGFVATGGGHGVGCNHDPGKLCAVLPFVAMAAAGAILGESRLGIRFGLEAGEQNQCVLPAASRPRRRGARPVGSRQWGSSGWECRYACE